MRRSLCASRTASAGHFDPSTQLTFNQLWIIVADDRCGLCVSQFQSRGRHESLRPLKKEFPLLDRILLNQNLRNSCRYASALGNDLQINGGIACTTNDGPLCLRQPCWERPPPYLPSPLPMEFPGAGSHGLFPRNGAGWFHISSIRATGHRISEVMARRSRNMRRFRLKTEGKLGTRSSRRKAATLRE